MGKTPVFGILKRDGKVFVQIVDNCSKEQLLHIIKDKAIKGSTIYTDGWIAYKALIINGYKHSTVIHSDDEFVRGKFHINGIESFWSFTKRRLAKFNGLSNHTFYLHLKESGFRFNNKSKNIYAIMLNSLRKLKL